jgi:hypothetical protein
MQMDALSMQEKKKTKETCPRSDGYCDEGKRAGEGDEK